MKSKEELAVEYVKSFNGTISLGQDESVKNDFIAGFEAAEQWISIDDELPDDALCLLLKYTDKIFLGSRFGDIFIEDSGQMDPLIDKPTHWRPINI